MSEAPERTKCSRRDRRDSSFRFAEAEALAEPVPKDVADQIAGSALPELPNNRTDVSVVSAGTNGSDYADINYQGVCRRL